MQKKLKSAVEKLPRHQLTAEEAAELTTRGQLMADIAKLEQQHNLMHIHAHSRDCRLNDSPIYKMGTGSVFCSLLRKPGVVYSSSISLFNLFFSSSC